MRQATRHRRMERAQQELTRAAQAVPALLAAGLVTLGAGGLALPGPLAALYGVPLAGAEDETFLRGMAARDLALGVYLVARLAAKRREGLGDLLFASALIPAFDCALVARASRQGRGNPWAMLLHGGSALGLVATGALLRGGGAN